MTKYDLLLKEIDIVQSEIARFDSNGLTIKKWSTAMWVALMAYSLRYGLKELVVIAIVTVFLFFIVELTYRRYQTRFIRRSEYIEDILKRGPPDEQNYTYEVHATASNPSKDELLEAVKQPQLWLYYLGTTGVSVAIYVCGSFSCANA